MLSTTVIPELPYPDVTAAADWLCEAFGFRIRLRIANHRVQLELGDGAVVVIEASEQLGASAVLVRVDDADAHCERAQRAGARITSRPADYPYGERQYNAVDIGGHQWTFSQSIADVDPAEWGGTLS